MAKVRIGFIGCGGRAGSHIEALRQHDGAEIVAVADVVEAAARRAGERLGVPFYTDHAALLQRDDLDAAFVSVPVFAHGPVELAIIGRGLPFFVEKPVARQLATAKEVAAALKASGLWAAVGYQLRYEEGVRRARAFLAGKTVSVVEGHYWCGTNRTGGWQNDWDGSGGQLVEQATHTVDLMRHLVGEVAEVYCRQASRVLYAITSPDSYALTLGFENGALGGLTTSWAYDGRDWSHANALHIISDNCLVRLSGGGVQVLPEGSGELPPAAGVGTIYDAFVDSVRTGKPDGVLSTYDDALATLAVTLAANESARSGRVVRVADAVGA